MRVIAFSCLSDESEMFETTSVIRSRSSTICWKVSNASELILLPRIVASMRFLLSSAASELLSASVRTSSATTAKPFPASPARAASTAAFKARILVWNAISSISLITFAIFREDSLISFTERTSISIFSLLYCTSCRIDWESPVACTICSAFFSTSALVSSVESLSSCTAAACFTEVSANIWLAFAMSCELDATDIATLIIFANMKSFDCTR